MTFVPIELNEYVRLHVKANPTDRAADVAGYLQSALEAYQAGERCQCGNPIWVIGSSQVGHMCFTCITGEAVPSDDYEIAGACDKLSAP